MGTYSSDHGLKVQLLRLGVSPRRAVRMLREWDDHAEDLSSASSEERLGSKEVLLQAVSERPELRSWISRWPCVVFVLMPQLVLTALILAVVGGLVFAAESYQSSATLFPEWLVASIELMFWSVTRLAPLLLVGWIAVEAARRRTPLFWPLVGMMVMVVTGASLQLAADIDRITATGSVSVGLGLMSPFQMPEDFAERLASGLIMVVIPYLLWRLRDDGMGEKNAAP